MRSSLTARAALAAALLLTFGVAGCEDEDPADPIVSTHEPIPPHSSPTTESSTTPTEAGPVEPTLPTEAEAETKAGAEAFVEYYWEVVNHAEATGDTALLRSLSIETCVGCIGGAEAIERIYGRGGTISGGTKRVIVSELTTKPSGGWLASQTIQVARQRIRGAGDLDQISAPGRVNVVLGVSAQDDGWAITSLEVG